MNIADQRDIDIVINANSAAYIKLHEDKQKRHNSISYNLACEAKHILPPNLRDKLAPYNWPKSISPETIKEINLHEQQIWKDALQKIANIRHQAIVDDLERITFKISHHQENDHIKIQLIENIPNITEHPQILEEKMATYMAFIQNYKFIPKPKTFTVYQQQPPPQHNPYMAPNQIPIQFPIPLPTTATRDPNISPIVPNNQDNPPITPIRSNMKRPRTTPSMQIDLSGSSTSDSTDQLTQKITQLTSMFQSLITKVDLLEQKTSRPNSRSNSPNVTRLQRTTQQNTSLSQPYHQTTQPYQQHPHPVPPPPPLPMSYAYQTIQQQRYIPNPMYQESPSSNEPRRVHYN